MQLLFLIYSLGGGGAERVTVNLANHWAGHGHVVTIATLAGGGEASYRLDPRVGRIELNVARESGTALSALLGLVAGVIAVRRMLKRQRPDAAIGMMTTSAILLALASRGLKVRTAGAERIHPPCFPIPAAWHRLRRLTYGWLDVIVAQTRETADWLRRNTNASNVVVVPNAWMPIEDGPPAIDPATVVPTGRRLVLGVGRLAAQKRFDLLIAAFAQTADRHLDWHLAILGEGPLKHELEKQIERLDLTGRICLPGRAGNLGAWYRRADVFVLSSAAEGFPNVLLEAMGSGLAAAAFACPAGPSDLIEDGANGVLVPPLDGARLAAAMDRLMSDAAERGRLGKAALQVREVYPVDRIADLWLAALMPMARA